MKSKYLKYILHVVIIIGLIIAAAKYIHGEKVLQAIRSYDYAFAPALLALPALYLSMKAWRFIYLMRPVSDLPGNVLFRGYVAGTAATLVPGGVAARAGLMQQAGISVARSGVPVALSSILDQVVFVGTALLAAFWFKSVRVPALILLGILLIFAGLFLFPVSRSWLDRMAIAIAKRFNFADQWRKLLKSGREVMNARTILIALAITIAALLVEVFVLDLSLRGLGQYVPYATLFLPTSCHRC